MEMTMVLLVSAAALLLSPAVAHPTPRFQLEHSLKDIYDLADTYNKSLTKEHYVEDVEHLMDAGCENTFFCKVHQILSSHDKFGKNSNEERFVRTLAVFINGTQVNCTEVLKEVTNTGVTRPILNLLQNVMSCVQRRNLRDG